MKENYTQLYPNEQVSTAVGDYAFEHSTKLPKHITDQHAWASENHDKANYMISPLQAQFLVWTAKAVGAKRILEIGMYVGFSTMGWAEAVGPQGHVAALEFSPEYAALAEETFAKNGIKNIEVMIGDAKESLKNLGEKIAEPFDLVFIDADKEGYPVYLDLILSQSIPGSSRRLLKPGGIILADNILRRGLVADPSDANPWASKLKQGSERAWKEGDIKALDVFNKKLANDPRFETFLMPVFDGLGMGRLVD